MEVVSGSVNDNGSTIYDATATGGNMSLQCHYTVPADKTMFITDWTGGVSGNKAVRLVLQATTDFETRSALQTGLFHFQDIMLSLSGDSQHTFPLPLKVPARADVKISGNALTVSGEAAASFGFWIENE